MTDSNEDHSGDESSDYELSLREKFKYWLDANVLFKIKVIRRRYPNIEIMLLQLVIILFIIFSV